MNADILRRSPEEGARRVALHWLAQMREASVRLSSDADVATAVERPDDAEPLHRARVALRRLRATLREHEDVLVVGGRAPRALRQLNRATNDARDLDVACAWLRAEGEALPPDAREESARLVEVLGAEREATSRAAAEAFGAAVNALMEPLAARLALFYELRRLDGPQPMRTFGHQLAQRVRRGAAQIGRALETIRAEQIDRVDRPEAADGEGPLDRLHALRIRLKRQRAMLAPLTDTDPAVAAWYDLATRGQDQLGGMRDATLLAERAAHHRLPALERSLREVAAVHADLFLRTWCADDERLAQARALADAAADALARASMTTAHDEPPREIERKYLLHGFPPDAARVAPIRIEQGWLPGTTLRERLRRAAHPDGSVRCTRTVKFGPLGSRVELEEDADPALFEALWPYTSQARISKDRHAVPSEGHVWEIDVFHDRDLVLAEVELQPGEPIPAAPSWLAPWIARDVTEDPAYANSSMARGVPIGDTGTGAAASVDLGVSLGA